MINVPLKKTGAGGRRGEGSSNESCKSVAKFRTRKKSPFKISVEGCLLFLEDAREQGGKKSIHDTARIISAERRTFSTVFAGFSM